MKLRELIEVVDFDTEIVICDITTGDNWATLKHCKDTSILGCNVDVESIDIMSDDEKCRLAVYVDVKPQAQNVGTQVPYYFQEKNVTHEK